MKLIIREYLELLKESKELDALIPDLLLTMGLEVISSPQVGVRQFGVDVASFGKSGEYKNCLLLFVIKQGNLGRQDWDSNEQSIRQTLNEVKDVYLTNCVRAAHKEFKKIIVLCTGGDLKQDIQINWKGYVDSVRIDGALEFDFWGGDALSILIEKYMLSESILPPTQRSRFRRTLSMLSSPDYDLRDYYSLLNGLLTEPTKQKRPTAALKNLRTVNLILNILYSWARFEDNLKPAFLASERTILLTWENIRRNEYFRQAKVISAYGSILKTVFQVSEAYFTKIQKHCYVKFGLNGTSRYSIVEQIIVFEQVGILATIGLLNAFVGFSSNNQVLVDNGKVVLSALKMLIENHPVTNSPIYDSHIIEISLTIYLLALYHETEFIGDWIARMTTHIAFAYKVMGRHFPICTDSLDDAIEVNMNGAIPKDKLMELSTLLPILSHWCIALGLDDHYKTLREHISEFFPKTVLQIWYPDKETDEFLYTQNASFKSGVCDAPIKLEETAELQKVQIHAVQERLVQMEDFSAIKFGSPFLPLVASRHYRTAPLPLYWQQLIVNAKT